MEGGPRLKGVRSIFQGVADTLEDTGGHSFLKALDKQ